MRLNPRNYLESVNVVVEDVPVVHRTVPKRCFSASSTVVIVFQSEARHPQRALESTGLSCESDIRRIYDAVCSAEVLQTEAFVDMEGNLETANLRGGYTRP